MSHEATNWAIKQKGLPPAAKIVLWHLCDRYNPDFGCFPSQDALARDCEISRATLNRHLDALEERGLVAREARRDERTRKQLSTRYRLGFEADFEPAEGAKPCREMRHGNEAETVSQNSQKPCLKNDDSRVSNCDTNPVREPVREPVIERERASEREEGQEDDTPTVSREAWARRFRKAHAEWPTYADDSPEQTEKAWFALSEEDRNSAVEHMQAYLHHIKNDLKRKAICRFSIYLKEKRWERLPEKARSAGGGVQVALPFGKSWGALRLSVLMGEPDGVPPRLTAVEERLCADGKYDRDELMRGKWARCGWPKVNMMQDDAMHRHKGRKVDAVAERLGADFVQVPVGSAGWKAWQALHEERGWPWFEGDLGRVEWVYFPASPDAPDSYASPLEAVRAAMARFETEHAALTQKDAAE